ncbi:PRD domain-containing protein [Enterococcus gallinarum]|uniref:PRD domain-containing protein n=1 Tax=Enterococcus gallinarum TaxID=1353 RepID=UPI001EEE6261|nr:PRD domain-containing protein [Enterococcus gallinarum]
MKNRFIFIVLLRICVFLFPACRTTLPMRKRLTMSFLEMVKIKYRNAYQCVQKIKLFLVTNYRYDMSNDESLYLTIHIARLVQKNR